MKTCTKCKIEKPYSEYNKDKTKPDGFHPHCKSCISIAKKEYAKRNKEKLRQYHKEYRKENKLQLSKYHKQYLENGGREVRKKYREENKDKIKFLKQNNETVRRRAKQDSDLNGPEYRAWVTTEIKLCVYCGVNCSKNFHVDHVEPLNQNGKHELANLAISCPSCNLSKGQKSLLEFLCYRHLTSGNKPAEV